MNLEEKGNTAEVAPEAAAEVRIQAVQENSVRESGVQETGGEWGNPEKEKPGFPTGTGQEQKRTKG